MKPILNLDGGIDWGRSPGCITLHCPFTPGRFAVSLYATWSDVPEYWECTCGEKHHKTDPYRNRVMS
jgi:hypothetical protein